MARVINNLIDPVPQVVVDGQTYAPIPPLPWYQLVWAGCPSCWFFVGGALGALFGALRHISTPGFLGRSWAGYEICLDSCYHWFGNLIYLVLALLLTMAVNG